MARGGGDRSGRSGSARPSAPTRAWPGAAARDG